MVQGVLLDEWRGFHPHTTWSTVTLHHALATVEESDAQEVCTLGITRAYMTRRQGAGPLPTWDRTDLDAKSFRSGQSDECLAGDDPAARWLDLVLLRGDTPSRQRAARRTGSC